MALGRQSVGECNHAESLREGRISILLLQQRTPANAYPRSIPGGEAVFDVEHGVELRESLGLKVRELSRAQELAEEHRELILKKWHEYLA
jgi:Domain of unknown function (DUF4160)